MKINKKNNLELFEPLILNQGRADLLKEEYDTPLPTDSERKSSLSNTIFQLAQGLPKVSTLLKIPSNEHDTNIKDYILNISKLRHATNSYADTLLLRDVTRHCLNNGLVCNTDLNQTLKPKALLIAGLHKPSYLEAILNWVISEEINLVVFVDTDIQHLADSCSYIDWTDIKLRLTKHSIKTQFFIDSRLEYALSSACTWLLRENYFSSVNFYYFIDRVCNQHCMAANKYLSEESSYLGVLGKGFFEDNFNMLCNSIATSASTFHDYFRSSEDSLDLPIILVGSGPSLSTTMPLLKKIYHNKSALIIACGSSVTSLYSEGVIPDYVVLVERNESVYIKHRDATEHHASFKKTSLISATTVDCRIFEYYKDVLLYVRSSNLFSSLYNSSSILNHTHTTSSNAALSFALSLNPKSITLFGIDFGSSNRRSSRHASAHGEGSYRFTNAVRGLTGTHFTNQALLRSHSLFEDCIKYHSSIRKTDIFTCSPSPYSNLIKHLSIKSAEHIFSTPGTSKIKLSKTHYSFDLIKKIHANAFLDDIADLCIANEFRTCTSVHMHLIDNHGKDPFFRLLNPLISTLTLFLSGLEAQSNSSTSAHKHLSRFPIVTLYLDSIQDLANNVLEGLKLHYE